MGLSGGGGGSRGECMQPCDCVSLNVNKCVNVCNSVNVYN